MGKKKRVKKEKIPIPPVPIKRSSPLGWIVLLGPLFIVSFTLLFGRSIPFLKEQAAVEAEDAAEMVCRAAEEDIRAGNYQSAYGRLMYALQIKPDYADAYINLGKIYYLSGDIPAAINWLQKAVSLDLPQKDLVFNNLGLLYAQQGEYQTALAMFERALATGLSLEQIYSNIGKVQLSLGNYDKAEEAFQAALDQRPTVRNLYLEMLRKTMIDYRGDEEHADVYRAAQEQIERGLTDQELAAYDDEIVARFGRTEQRQVELERSLAYARQMKRGEGRR